MGTPYLYCNYSYSNRTSLSTRKLPVGAYQRHLAMTPADAKLGWQYFMNYE